MLSAWQEQVKATGDASLKQQLSYRENELLPRFAEHYQHLKTLRRRVRRSLQRQWKRSLAGVALLLALGQAPALAATINVGGACTLARAITAANNDTTAGGQCTRGRGADRIVLPKKKTFLLRFANNVNYGATGLPTIRTAITIAGNGSAIRRQTTAQKFRIFAVADTGSLTLQNTIVSGGSAVDRINSDGNSGGAVYSYKGSVNLVNSRILGNTARSGGGGVFMNGGALALTNSTISGNSATQRGGGVFVSAYGTATLTRSTISGNSTAWDGGGVFVSGGSTVTLNSSTLSRNTGNRGGGLFAGYNASINLNNSNISRNSADYGGGAYVDYGSTVTLKNGIITGNSAARQGGGMYVDYGATLTVADSTVTGNSATREGGGVYVGGDGTLNLTRTLVSGNVSPNGREVYASRGWYDEDSGNFYSRAIVNTGNFNLFGHSSSGGINFAPGITDLVPAQQLTQICNPTTGELVPGSQAINAINNGTCPLNDRDQRGALRNVGGTCDIGAIEFGGIPTTPPPPAPLSALTVPAPPLPPEATLPAPPEEPLSPPPGEPPAQPPEELAPLPPGGELSPPPEEPPPTPDGEQPPSIFASPPVEPPPESPVPEQLTPPEPPPASEQPSPSPSN